MHRLPLSDLLALAAVGAAIDLARSAAGIYEQVLQTDPILLAIAAALHLVDLPLGLWRGLTAGGGFRISRFDPALAGQWAANLVRYALAVAVLAMVANGTAHLPVISVITAGFDEAALLAVIALNLASILKHLFGDDGGVRRFFSRIGVFGRSPAAEALIDLVDAPPGSEAEQTAEGRR